MATATTRPRGPAATSASGRPQHRPLSPHLSIWKWRVHTITSITHRITGNIMAFATVVLFLWWLVAAATGPEEYATFYRVATGWVGVVVGIGLTWVLFQHMMSGVRHLVMDTGAALEIHDSKVFATATYFLSLGLTVLTWGAIALTKGL